MRKIMLLRRIRLKQKDMYSKAKHFGLTHPSVVTCSQELDSLINSYQEIQNMQYESGIYP